MSFYTQYRPQTIEELDLNSVRDSLSSILKTGKFSQAYLFTGPKGTGKTSSARIVAKVLNCEKNEEKLHEPCNQCENCRRITRGSSLDCVEMDAASNRGIDDIRSLRERVGLAPSEGKYTVYIIDEVHMLTTEAFNALLKTLEEPPAHAVFILCTTDTQKIPETVMSRCTRIQFAKANQEEIEHSLNKAVVGEKLSIDPEAVKMIAAAADGSFRDGMKLLEQLAHQGKAKISIEAAAAATGFGDEFNGEDLFTALMNRDSDAALVEIAKRAGLGIDLMLFSKKLLELIRNKLVMVVSGDRQEVAKYLDLAEKIDEAVVKMKVSSLPQLVLEVAAVRWCTKEGQKPKTISQKPEIVEVVKETVKAVAQPVIAKDLFEGKLEEVKQKWTEILAAVKPLNHSLEALLRSARPAGIRNGVLIIEAFYKFHKEQLEQEKHRQKLEEAMSGVLGGKIRLEIVLGDKSGVQPDDDPLVKAAAEIFS